MGLGPRRYAPGKNAAVPACRRNAHSSQPRNLCITLRFILPNAIFNQACNNPVINPFLGHIILLLVSNFFQ